MHNIYILNPDVVVEHINKLSCQPLGHRSTPIALMATNVSLDDSGFLGTERMSGILRAGLGAPHPEGGLGP